LQVSANEALFSPGLFLLPMLLLTGGSALVVEGFRAAAGSR
jgi:hypothetical protein